MGDTREALLAQQVALAARLAALEGGERSRAAAWYGSVVGDEARDSGGGRYYPAADPRAQGRRSRWFSRRAARERPRRTATAGAGLASAVCSGSCRRPFARPAAEGPAARARGATALADGREEADKEADQKQRNDGHGGFCY